VIVAETRSGLAEAVHPVSAVAVDATGRVLDSFGSDLERDFYARSAIKPFQAFVSQRNGADLAPEQLAMAMASHAGQPVHIAIVGDMLRGAGLSEEDLMCPPARPAGQSADLRWAAAGRLHRERVFHNCSGKHAAVLRACVAGGWSTSYLDQGHPFNQEVADIVERETGRPPGPAGVDGCGLPTLRTDVTALARGFARLVTRAEFREIAGVAARHAALTSDGDRAEAVVARWVPAVVKGGAMGCVGAGWIEGGIGFAAKAWSGNATAASVALVAIMDRAGILSIHQRAQLAAVASPRVLGGGEPVGAYELVVS
jgi:L-asparaginase II